MSMNNNPNYLKVLLPLLFVCLPGRLGQIHGLYVNQPGDYLTFPRKQYNPP